MLGFSKTDQSKKKTRDTRTCSKCDRKRLIKFFSKPTARVCNDCKLKAKRVKQQSNIGKIKKNVEDLAKKCAKKRDKYICQKCGSHVEGVNAHGSHVIPVSASQYLRFDIDNIKCLCFKCHIGWWHKNPLEASDWFKTKFPDRYKYLEENKNTTHKWTRDELSALKKKYENILSK